MNRLIDLLSYGQSYWLDNLTRKKIQSGELEKRVIQQGLRGITSNPSIFNKAISGSTDYDDHIADLVKQGKNPEQIYDALTIRDVQDACDILKPVYDQSKGIDGFVSLEVSPYLARDTEGTMTEARRLFKAVGRSNCLIKIPGTCEGIPAIEQMLYEGINVNITLLFSVERYEETAQAYIRAIERRVSEKKSVDTIISVASIFISRIDVLTDQLLGQKKADNHSPDLLSGKAGIATARLSYQRFKEIFNTASWKKLEEQGAHVQRPLWASTSNKDPLYDDLRYVDTLIGKNTVNTLPDKTIDAFSAHGNLKKDSIEENLDEAEELFSELKKAGVDMHFITQQLENEGVQSFTEAYNELISNLADKRMKIIDNRITSQQISCGKLDKELNAAYASLDEKQTGKLLFEKDPYLWKADKQQVKEIDQRLGWLTLPDNVAGHVKSLVDFALNVKNEGYTDAVLLGMGGSSLCSEVAKETFGTAEGYLQLHVLDNTDPAAILALQKNINIDKTLFIVASKSGGTQETLSFFHYFYEQLKNKNKDRPGDNFVAITDDGTPLVTVAEQYKFRNVFVNPSDLGGRYSVLSDFGLVPMALMGIDIAAFLASAKQMETSCDNVPAAANPGISLGAVLGICEKHGRDKITFVLSSSIKSFGYWAEQLLAESTGKDGRGLIPINGELPSGPEAYGNDRLFVHISLSTDETKEDDQKINALEAAGQPVVRINVANKLALGGEYYRWEIAVAIAGIIIGINAFDQPNVEESKKNTKDLLEGWSREGAFKRSTPVFEKDTITVYSGKRTEQLIARHHESAGEVVGGYTAEAKANDYIALLPYFLLTNARTKKLQEWRQQLRDDLKVATTLLAGPRYLHSTGQLHKGGPDTGLYLILVGDEEQDLAIPGEKFGFAVLHQAQALGDFRSLDDKGRRVIRINLGKDIDAGLDKLIQSIHQINKQHPLHK